MDSSIVTRNFSPFFWILSRIYDFIEWIKFGGPFFNNQNQNWLPPYPEEISYEEPDDKEWREEKYESLPVPLSARYEWYIR